MDPRKDTWTETDKLEWLSKQTFQRSYEKQVLSRISKLKDTSEALKIRPYGRLTLQGRKELALDGAVLSAKEYEDRYPLFYAEVGDITNGKINIIVTGGTHGYEESGVYGALEFLERDALDYSDRFNFLVFPCLSPFAYEVNQRWTHDAWDPNRSFDRSKPYVPEAQLVMDVLDEARQRVGHDFAAAVDLHETPDRDKTMMPPQYQRYGIDLKPEDVLIPNGYYLISSESNEAQGLASRIVETVRKVTPIAPDPEIHGAKNENGVVVERGEDTTHQGLNMEYMRTLAENSFTTEIYPEIHPEPRGSEEAIAAQRATVLGMLSWWQ